jgi:hypothetical protein
MNDLRALPMPREFERMTDRSQAVTFFEDIDENAVFAGTFI